MNTKKSAYWAHSPVIGGSDVCLQHDFRLAVGANCCRTLARDRQSATSIASINYEKENALDCLPDSVPWELNQTLG